MGAEASKMGSETSDMGTETSPIGLNFKKIFDSLDSAMRQDGPECQPDTIGGIVKNPPEGVPDLKKVKVALLNAHSINNKLENIRDLITENNLDVFLITETWLKFVTGNDDIRQALPETFQYHHEPRQGQRGGGVAITFKNSFINDRVLLHNSNRYSTFEYVAAKLQDSEWEDPVLFINVYRPSRIRWELINRNSTKFQKFLNEFQELLNEAHIYQKIIVTGDFNVWYDDDKVKKTREFKSFLITNNLVQLVASKTHNKGHILDLVITRNVNIDFLYVENEEMSDHYTVYFNILGKKKQTESSEN